MHVNLLHNNREKRKLCLILIKIAQIPYMPLMPYFQDYEVVNVFILLLSPSCIGDSFFLQVSKNVGTVTVAHFSRVLHFMKIQLSDDDFLLLLKRYMKDSYMVNYVAFLKHLDSVKIYLKEQGLTTFGDVIYTNFFYNILLNLLND